MKKDGTVDLRIKRTQNAIKESFFELVDKKGFEHISVKDITDGAMISRNTFYLHYSDKYELLDRICDELMRTLFFRVGKQVRRVQQVRLTAEGVSTVIAHGINVIKADREKYRILFGSSGSDMLGKKLTSVLRRCLDLASDSTDVIDDLSGQYIVSGLIGIIKYYVNNTVDDDADIDEKCLDFTKNNLGRIIEIANLSKEYE